MCRLIAFQGPSARDLRYAMLEAPNAFIHQSVCDKSACEPNEDGWGFARWESTEPELIKQPNKAHADPRFAELAAEPHSRVFAHIRRSSAGKPRLENTHPFQLGRDLLFAHNGSIYGFENIREHALELLPGRMREQIRGETDSEFVMMLFASRFLAGNDWESTDVHAFRKALRDTVDAARRLGDLAGTGKPPKLNFMFLTKHVLISTRVIHTLGFYDDFAGGVLITSEALAESDGWQAMEEETMIFVTRDGAKEVLKF